ncbi:MAG: polymerase, sigma-24 subunit, subfamily [Spartobacteria bacterium]|nr:polymerase, sigma-24 subunit, subfamily [Spartobacteria bacterium]
MEHDSFDEQDSLRRIDRGDEIAARELLRHFHPFVLKLVRAHLPRRISEEDLVQMIFIKVFHKLSQYSGRMPLQHWISRIAVNTCLNSLKAEKIRPEWRLSDFSEEIAAGIEKLAATEVDTATTDDCDLARKLVNELIAQLSPEDRLVITLLHLEEKSVEEIHALTGWSRSVIKVRAFRARGKMKEILHQRETLAVA